MVRVVSYFSSSLVLMLFTVYYAYHTQRQFYPTIQFLVSSKVSFVVLGNMILATIWMAATLFKSIYFGPLREVEVELLIEKAKYTITETLLALTIFRNDLSPPVIMMFIGLIVVKLLHKLSKCRLEYLEQIMPVATSTQLRVIFLLTTLISMDTYATYTAVSSVMTRGRSVLILFGFEFGLLLLYGLNLLLRFIIQTIDANMTHGLQSRGLYIMVVDLFCEVIKIITYVSFFCLVFVYYGIPLHIMRDVYAAYQSFQRKLLNFIKYLRLTQNLENRFPTATEEEIAAAGNCLVCREEMDTGKKLPCGHIFHLNCLRAWLQHQQACPLCRADIPVQNVVPAPMPPTEDLLNLNPENANAPRIDGATEETIETAARSETSSMALSSLSVLLKKATFPSAAGDVQLPSFYLVVSEDNVVVRKDPLLEADVVRELAKGTVLFVFSRVSGSGGCQWLKAPDGWVLESCQRGSFGANAASGPGRVFISGLPYNTEDERITDMFSAFGPIKQFHQVRDPGSNAGRGTAFCEYVDPTAAETAVIGLNGIKLGEKTLTVRTTIADASQQEEVYLIPLAESKGKSKTDPESFSATASMSESEMKGLASPIRPAPSSLSESPSSKSASGPSAKVYSRDHFLSRLTARESNSTISSPTNEKNNEQPVVPIESISTAKDGIRKLEKSVKSLTDPSPSVAVKKTVPAPVAPPQPIGSIASDMTLSRLDSSTTRLQAMLKLQVSMEEATKNVVELGQTLLRCQQSWSEIIRDELHAMERMRNSVCASTAADLQDEKEGVQSEGHDG